jgi:hypothetical protein
MTQNIFDIIRQSCARVAKRPEFLDINTPLISEYAQKLELLSDEETFDEHHHYIADEEKTAAYISLLNAINFGSGDFPLIIEEEFPLIDGNAYFSFSTRLKEFFENEDDLSPQRFISLSDVDTAQIFKLPYDKPVSAELAGRYTDALRDMARWIEADFDGKFYNFVKAADGKAATLVEMLSAQKRFRDVQVYKGEDVFFMKRGQCLAADLHQGFKHLDGRTLFEDMDCLSMLADCDLPHVLRMDDILFYGPQLVDKVDNGLFITAGSQEEVELRAVSLHAVELIAKEKGVSAIDIDHALWHRKQLDLYTKTSHLPHRTRTNFY